MGAPKNEWAWWSGSTEEIYENGPLKTRDDAIQEAVDQANYEEHQNDDGSWYIGIYVAEHQGTYYDCDKCGRIDVACVECQQSLESYEPHWFFAQTRNQDYVKLPHPSDESTNG